MHINKKKMKMGSYTTGIVVMALVFVVFLNIVVNGLPSTYTKFDTSSTKLYSISDQTKQIMAGIDKDVTVYLIAQTGNEDETLLELLGRYQALNNKIIVTKKDPVVDPTFTKSFTNETVQENSLIVVCGEKSRYISVNSIYVTDYSIDSSGQYVQTSTFEGESQITSAISYVTSDSTDIIYYLSGHGETDLTSSVKEGIKSDNFDLKSLNLLTEDAVPEDCSCLLISGISNDISESEKELILSYLEKGGRMLCLLDYLEVDMPNLESLISTYGVNVAKGMVVETDSRYCYRYQNFLVPEFNSHEITRPISGYNVLLPYAKGLVICEDVRDGLTINSLMDTSEEAFSKVDFSNSEPTKQDGDVDGPFSLGVAITDTNVSGSTEEDSEAAAETKLVILSTSQMLDETINSFVSGMNEELFLNSLNWLCEKEESIAIRGKSLDAVRLSMDSSVASTWSMILIGVIPVCVLVIGGMYLRRRKSGVKKEREVME